MTPSYQPPRRRSVNKINDVAVLSHEVGCCAAVGGRLQPRYMTPSPPRGTRPGVRGGAGA